MCVCGYVCVHVSVCVCVNLFVEEKRKHTRLTSQERGCSPFNIVKKMDVILFGTSFKIDGFIPFLPKSYSVSI